LLQEAPPSLPLSSALAFLRPGTAYLNEINLSSSSHPFLSLEKGSARVLSIGCPRGVFSFSFFLFFLSFFLFLFVFAIFRSCGEKKRKRKSLRNPVSHSPPFRSLVIFLVTTQKRKKERKRNERRKGNGKRKTP